MANTERLYKIERLIRVRGVVSFQVLRDELEVSPATLKRDLEYLRSRLGAPIEYDRDANGYRLGAQPAGVPGQKYERVERAVAEECPPVRRQRCGRARWRTR